MPGIVALSWSGSVFLSTLENYVPASFPITKGLISGGKFVVALPIRLVEWTGNQIFGVVETAIIGRSLPTNITEVYKLNVVPKLKDLEKLRKPAINWVIQQLKNAKGK